MSSARFLASQLLPLARQFRRHRCVRRHTAQNRLSRSRQSCLIRMKRLILTRPGVLLQTGLHGNCSARCVTRYPGLRMQWCPADPCFSSLQENITALTDEPGARAPGSSVTLPFFFCVMQTSGGQEAAVDEPCWSDAGARTFPNCTWALPSLAFFSVRCSSLSCLPYLTRSSPIRWHSQWGQVRVNTARVAIITLAYRQY